MSVSNGQTANASNFNTAFLSRTVNTSAVGKIDLNNVSDTLSGDTVTNVQRHVNEGHQDEKVFFRTENNLTLSFDGTQISCLDDIKIHFPDGGFVNTIDSAAFPLAIANGEHAYLTINRYANATIGLTVAAVLPKGKDVFRFASRVNDAIIFWDNTVIRSGDSTGLGSSFGVTSIKKNGDSVSLTGDVQLKEGTNVTISRTGQILEITALGGGGGGGVSYSEDEGNVEITLRPATSSWILESPDLTIWEVTTDNDGNLTATSGATGTPSNIKVTKPDLSEASFAITNAGELQVISPAAGGTTLNDGFFLLAPNNKAWRITASNLDELQAESDTTETNHFSVLSDTGQNLFRVQEANGLALNYLPVYDSATLPASPTVIAGCLPWAFYDNGPNNRPIYWDGSAWLYFADNSAV